MLTLFYIIIFIELLTVFYNLFKFLLYKLFSSSNKQHNNVKNSNNNFHINVLIPCYNEINIISNTLNYFEKITKNFNNIDIYVITTDKEKLVVNFKRFKVYIKDYFSTCLSILFTGLGPLYSLFLKEKVKTER